MKLILYMAPVVGGARAASATCGRHSTRTEWRRPPRHHQHHHACCNALSALASPSPKSPPLLPQSLRLPRTLHEERPSNPLMWQALLTRATSTFQMGRPHCAIADLLRILAAEAVADPEAVARAHQLLDQALPAQRALFERMMPPRPKAAEETYSVAGPVPAFPTPSAANSSSENRSCIYRIKTGSLLFRGSAPSSTAVRAGASFPTASSPTASSAGRTEQRRGHSNEPPPASLAPFPSSRGPALSPIPVLDARTAEGIRGALTAARASHAVLMRNTRLVEETASWSGDELARQLRGATCHVLAAPRTSNRFTYYWGGRGDALHSHYDVPATVQSVGMEYPEFRDKVHAAASDTALYLQTGLTQRGPDGQLVDALTVGDSMRRVLRRLRRAADREGDGGSRGGSNGGSRGGSDGGSNAGGDGGGGQGFTGGECDSSAAPGDTMHNLPAGAQSIQTKGCQTAEDAVQLVQSMVTVGSFGRYSRTAFFASCPGVSEPVGTHGPLGL